MTAVDVHPLGTSFVTATSDGSLRLWDAETKQQVGRVMHHASRITKAQFTPDGNAMIASYLDGSIRHWDLRTFSEIGLAMKQSKEVTLLAVSHSGEWAATASADFTARLWHVAPVTGSLEEVRCQYETSTGMSLAADGSVSVLSIEQWNQRRQPIVKKEY